MITVKNEDLLLQKDCIIVHGCNAQGVMNSGVAKDIRSKWPKAYDDYKDWYDLSIYLGLEHIPLGYVHCVQVEERVWICNAITQKFYGRNQNTLYADYDAGRKAFASLNRHIFEFDFLPKRVCFPKIMCGLANGDWEIVSKFIDEELDDSIEKILCVQ